MQSISVFLDIAKFADFRWKMLMSAELKGCVTWFIYFLDLLWVRYNCAKFYHCRICGTGFREGGLFALHLPAPIREQPQKSPSWIELRCLKTLKPKKLNTENPPIKHCPCSKYVMIYRPDLQTWCTIYRPGKNSWRSN